MPKINIKREPMTQEETADMIQRAKNERDKALIALLYLTGGRISEVLKLKKANITMDDKYIYVAMIPEKRRDSGPLLVVNTLPISRQAPFVDVILNWWAKVEDYLFTGYKAPMTRTRAWQIIKSLNPNTFPHFFRHTRASKLWEAGRDVFEIRDWLGRKTLPVEYIRASRRRLTRVGKAIK